MGSTSISFERWPESQTPKRGRRFVVVQASIGAASLGLLVVSRRVPLPVAQGAGFVAAWAGGAICLGTFFYVLARAGLLIGTRRRLSLAARPTVSQRQLFARAPRALQLLSLVLAAGSFVFGGVRIPLPGGGTTATRDQGQYYESFKGRLLRPITRTQYEQLRTDDVRGDLQWLTLAAAVTLTGTSGALRIARATRS